MKSTILKNTIFFLLFLVSTTIAAQVQLTEGYIVTHEGEKIQGYIDDFTETIGIDKSKITFRVNKDAPGKEYDHNTIKMFSIHGIVYEGGLVDVEMSPRNTERLNRTSDLIIQKQFIFLQTIISGEKSLYSYKAPSYDLFYIKNNEAFELLVYKKYLGTKEVRGKESYVVFENKLYREQLANYLTGCPEISAEIASARYSQGDITNIFFKYYRCSNEHFISYEPKRKGIIKVGLIAGYTLTSLDYNFAHSHNQLTKVAQQPFNLGLSLNGRISRDIVMVGEFSMFSGYSYVLPTEFYFEPGYTAELEYSYHATAKKATLLARHYLPYKSAHFYVNIGCSYQRVKGYCDVEHTRTTTLTSRKDNYNYVNNKDFMRLSTGVGVKYKKFSLETRVEPSFTDTYLGTSISFIAGYRFDNVNP